MCGKEDLALNGYRTVLMYLHEQGDLAGNSAWNCALLSYRAYQKKETKGGMTTLRSAVDYGRLAMALYKDEKRISECDETVKTFMTKVKSESKSQSTPRPTDDSVPDRDKRACPLPTNGLLAAQIEEEWGHINRMRFDCSQPRLRQKLYPQLLKIATHLIEIDPNGRPLYYLYKADVLFEQKNNTERVAVLQKALQIFPDSAFTSPILAETSGGIRLILGHEAKEQKNFNLALKFYTEVIKSVDDTACAGPSPFRIINELLLERALSFRTLLLRKEARLQDHDRLISLNSTNHEYWRERGITHQSLNAKDKAESDMRRATELERAISVPDNCKTINFTQLCAQAHSASAAAAGSVPVKGEPAGEMKRGGGIFKKEEPRVSRSRDYSPVRRVKKGGERSRSRSPRRLHDRLHDARQPGTTTALQQQQMAEDVKMTDAHPIPVPVPPPRLAQKRKKLSDWSRDETADWFANFSPSYRQAIIANSVDGHILDIIANEPNDNAAHALLRDCGIVPDHCVTILDTLRANFRDSR